MGNAEYMGINKNILSNHNMRTFFAAAAVLAVGTSIGLKPEPVTHYGAYVDPYGPAPHDYGYGTPDYGHGGHGYGHDPYADPYGPSYGIDSSYARPDHPYAKAEGHGYGKDIDDKIHELFSGLNNKSYDEPRYGYQFGDRHDKGHYGYETKPHYPAKPLYEPEPYHPEPYHPEPYHPEPYHPEPHPVEPH